MKDLQLICLILVCAAIFCSQTTLAFQHSFNEVPIRVSPLRPENFDLSNEIIDDSTHKRDSSPLTYHGGPVMRGVVNIYVIWYGNWEESSRNTQVYNIVNDFLNGFGGTPWMSLNSDFGDSYGKISGDLKLYSQNINFGKSNYEFGSTLDSQALFNIVHNGIQKSGLPFDQSGIYLVLTSADVKQYTSTNYGFCTSGNGYCGFHTYYPISIGGTTKNIKYAFIGDPSQCGSCASQQNSPNGDWAADAMVSIIAHEIAEAVTDPEFNGWTDANNYENADKCSWTYGSKTYLADGSAYNVEIGSRKYLIQQLWKKDGGCAMTPVKNQAEGIVETLEKETLENVQEEYTVNSEKILETVGKLNGDNSPHQIENSNSQKISGNFQLGFFLTLFCLQKML